MMKKEASPGTVEYWAASRPHDLAIVDAGTRLTWADWNERADRAAAALATLGLGADDIVAVRTHIRHEWSVIALALAKLDCRILLMNWRLTPSEISKILKSSGAVAFVCDDRAPELLSAALNDLALKVAVTIDVSADGFVDYASLLETSATTPRFSAGQPQLIVYTSGTTGLPKGIATRKSADAGLSKSDALKVSEYQLSVANARPQQAGDVILLTMPMSHGAGPAIVFGAARLGNTVVMQRRFDPEQTLQLIDEHRISMWNAVPTLFKRLAALPPSVIASYDLSTLRSLSVSAAPISIALKQWVIGHLADCLSESYGTSETGVLTTLTKEMQRAKIGSSGRPHAHVDISIRDLEGIEQDTGKIGEIWARTPIVIRQYLGGEPIGEDTLDRLGFFKTGDAGYLDEDGYLFITDRTKDMIVSGGTNIFPAEIEAAIARHPAVQDVAVFGIPDEDFGERPMAVCELKPGQHADEAGILAFCKDSLASYKQPRKIAFVEELPRNPMGKILKRDLRQPYWEGRARAV